MNKPRIDQLIRQSGLVRTRQQAHDMIKDGRVKVDGKVITNIAYQTRPSTHVITIDNKPLELVEDKKYFIVNKPEGYSCQQGEHPNVTDLIRIPDVKIKNSLFAVGRLDKDSTGLIVVMNDGKLVHKILDPDKEVKKTYIADVDKELTQDAIHKIIKGVTIKLEDGLYTCAPAEIKKISDKKYEIRITEGKKRQVRRMLFAVGSTCLKLHRTAIGQMILPEELKIGEYKEVAKEFIMRIFIKDQS